MKKLDTQSLAAQALAQRELGMNGIWGVV